MAALTDKSWKFPVNVYWVTSREADDCCWSAVLAPQHEAVREYKARVARGDAVPDHLAHLAHVGDINEYWIGLWKRKAHDGTTRGTKTTGGVAVPMFLSEQLVEVWKHVRGTQERARARTLARSQRSRGRARALHRSKAALKAHVGASRPPPNAGPLNAPEQQARDATTTSGRGGDASPRLADSVTAKVGGGGSTP